MMKTLIIISLIATALGSSQIVNTFVERTIDVSTQLVKATYKITVDNTVAESIYDYSFVIPLAERASLAYISAKDASKRELLYHESNTDNTTEFRFKFNNPNVHQSLNVEIVATKALKPHPAKITQSEKQLVQYFGSAYFYSPYKTLGQKTVIQLGVSNVESYTHVKPCHTGNNAVVYGPYDEIHENAIAEIVVHFENQTPFLTVTRLERVLEVSHWGNIAVTENIEMSHTGAQLKGSFSRYDFQKDARSGQAAVRSYKTILPASATGVYYRDTNGNISTSNMKILRDSVELELRPRFPLFGGWKTFYMLGYNVPSFEYLYSSDQNFLLKMRIIDHIFDDMVIDEAVVKIILPEGATNIRLTTPYKVNRLPDSLHYTYLDTYGRPVIAFTKNNLVEMHINDFTLEYDFSRVHMLQEPLLAVGFLFVLFLVVIVCHRLDFSISREKEVHLHKD